MAPAPVLRLIFRGKHLVSRNNFNRAMRWLSTEKIESVGCCTTLRYQIPDDDGIAGNTIQMVSQAKWEAIEFPKVYGISNGGRIEYWSNGIKLLAFENGIQHPYSDFIRFGKNAYWDKKSRFQLRKTLPFDKDLINVTSGVDYCYLEEPLEFQDFDEAFSLCGVHASLWGHFIPTFLPKLQCLGDLPTDREIAVVIPNNADDHIRQFVIDSCRSFANCRVINLRPECSIRARRLYFCTSPAFLIDHATNLHTADFQISDWSIQGIKKFADIATSTYAKSSRPRKLYIGRDGLRNIVGQAELEKFFVSSGYEKVYPHKLLFNEKVDLFNNSSHIAGPGSSGFANVIFCQPGTKVLMLSSYTRTIDGYLSTIANSQFSLDLTLLAGFDNDQSGIHSDYAISVDEVRQAARNLGFV